MAVEEFGDHVRAERKGHAAVILSPSSHILVRVRPQQVAEQPSVGYVGGAHDAADLLHVLKVRGEASVAAKYFFIDDGGDGKAIEAVGEGLPQFYVVSSLALIIKTIDPIDAGTLMVPTEKEKVFRVLDFVGEKEAYSFQRLLSTIHIVPQKEIVCFRGKATVLKESQKVIVLPMDVPTNLEGGLQL